MKSVKLFLILLLAINLYNCAHHEIKINPVVAPYQKTDNEVFITSELKHVVSVAHYSKIKYSKDKTIFMIIVENNGEKPLYISNENISVIFEGNSQKWASKIINLQTPTEFMINLSGDLTIRDQLQDNYLYKTPSVYTDVLDGPKELEERTLLDIDTLMDMPGRYEDLKKLGSDKRKSTRLQLLYSLPRIVIKPQNIMPNDSITGIFVCDTRDMDDKLEGDFKITVTIDGERHKFTFARKSI